MSLYLAPLFPRNSSSLLYMAKYRSHSAPGLALRLGPHFFKVLRELRVHVFSLAGRELLLERREDGQREPARLALRRHACLPLHPIVELLAGELGRGCVLFF